MKCPECKSHDDICIYVTRTTKAYIDPEGNVLDSEDMYGIEWDDNNAAECGACYWEGRVGQLIVEDAEGKEGSA